MADARAPGPLALLHDQPAPAKLNLFLHVVGRRPDGLHLLQSVFVLIDWMDTLHFERLEAAHLERVDLGAPLPADDLCLRAARALRAAAGRPDLGARIAVAKRVPAGAGMGGGSSDAATTLLALNRLWGLGWPRDRLAELGLGLGADVPFFVHGHNAWVEGVGERITPVAVRPRWLAVLKPPVALSTGAVFGSPLLARDTPAAIIQDFLAHERGRAGDSRPDGDSGPGCVPFGHNDLQRAAEAASPEVTEALARLEQVWGASRMTGSGSAVFAQAAWGELPEPAWPQGALPEGWVARMCRSLPQHPLLEA